MARKIRPKIPKTILPLTDSKKNCVEYFFKNYKQLRNIKGSLIDAFAGDGMFVSGSFPKKVVMCTANAVIRDFYSSIGYRMLIDVKMLDGYIFRVSRTSDERNLIMAKLEDYLNGKIGYDDLGVTKHHIISKSSILYALCRLASSSQNIKLDNELNFGNAMQSRATGIINVITPYMADYFQDKPVSFCSSIFDYNISDDDFVYMNIPASLDVDDKINAVLKFQGCKNGLLLLSDTPEHRALLVDFKYKVFCKNQLFESCDISSHKLKNTLAVFIWDDKNIL